MEDYIKLCNELIEEHIQERQEYLASEKAKDDEWHIDTRKEILGALLDDTENVFGNIDGSRTCNSYEAQQFIDKSGAIWDSEIHDLFDEIDSDYFLETLKRGAETLDVVILELLSSRVINELLDNETVTV
jgi:hypothetical protein